MANHFRIVESDGLTDGPDTFGIPSEDENDLPPLAFDDDAEAPGLIQLPSIEQPTVPPVISVPSITD